MAYPGLVRARPAVIVVAALVILGGCAGGKGKSRPNSAAPPRSTLSPLTTLPASTTTTQDPSSGGLKATAQPVLSVYAAGNWGSFWDHWDPTSQALITRAEYIRRKMACPGITGVPISVQSVQQASGSMWNVVGRGIGSPVNYQFTYVQGQWFYVITNPAVKSDLLEPFARYITRPGCNK